MSGDRALIRMLLRDKCIEAARLKNKACDLLTKSYANGMLDTCVYLLECMHSRDIVDDWKDDTMLARSKEVARILYDEAMKENFAHNTNDSSYYEQLGFLGSGAATTT